MPDGLDKVECDSALPERSDPVVIGGRIAGVSSALALAEKGVSMTLCGGRPYRQSPAQCSRLGRRWHRQLNRTQ